MAVEDYQAHQSLLKNHLYLLYLQILLPAKVVRRFLLNRVSWKGDAVFFMELFGNVFSYEVHLHILADLSQM